MSIRIETDRLVLRQFSAEDAVELNSICNEPYVLKWMPDWQVPVERTKELISWLIKQYALATKDSARAMMAVTLKENGEMIGMVGIGNKKEVDNEIEIAYFVSENYSNRGYISEAAKAMSKWTLDSLGLDYLIAIVETDNYPSQRVIEKCGFEKIDTRMILNSGETQEKPFIYYRLYSE